MTLVGRSVDGSVGPAPPPPPSLLLCDMALIMQQPRSARPINAAAAIARADSLDYEEEVICQMHLADTAKKERNDNSPTDNSLCSGPSMTRAVLVFMAGSDQDEIRCQVVGEIRRLARLLSSDTTTKTFFFHF